MLPSPASRTRRGHGPRRRTFALATGLALIANLSLFTLPQAAAEAVCGESLEGSITLSHDIVDCAGDGLVIDAKSGITIDLNGHTVSAADGNNGSGVVVTNGAKRIKVINGTIEGFGGYGVDIRNSSSTRADNLLVRTDASGSDAISVQGSSGVTINNVVLLGSSAFAGVESYENTGKITVSNSSIRGFQYGIYATAAYPGFALTLSNNVILGSEIDGIHYEDNPGKFTVLSTKIVDSAGDGVSIDCQGDGTDPYGPIVLTGNRIFRSGSDGVVIEDCEGGKSTVSNNISAMNGGDGFSATNLPNSSWSGNRSADNGDDGLYLDTVPGSSFTNNRLDVNAGAGMYFESDATPPSAITDNFARGNDFAAFHVGGGGDLLAVSNSNVALSAFSDSPECDGITCVEPLEPGTPNPDCGEVISTSIVLSADLECTTAAALVVQSGASRVTIDLNGHTLTTAPPSGSAVGIQISGPGPTKSITIKGGVIAGALTAGVAVSGQASTAKAQGVLFELDDESNGVTVGAADQVATLSDVVTRVAGSAGAGAFVANYPAAPARVTIDVTGSLFVGGYGGVQGDLVRVDSSIFLDGNFMALGAQDDSKATNSVFVGGASDSDHIIVSCQNAGTFTASNNIVVGPTINVPYEGFLMVGCSSATFADNLTMLNTWGYEVSPLGNMKFTGNRSLADTVGFQMTMPTPPASTSTSAVFKGNYADAGGDGFTFNGAGSVRAFSGNFARGNERWGFYSSDDLLAGSGNIAFGSGPHPDQENCINVTCSIGPIIRPAP